MADTALLVIDLQRGAFDGARCPPVDQPETLIAAACELVAAARAGGVPVVWVQHGEGAGAPFEEGSPHWELHEALVPAPGELRVAKRESSAFAGTELDDQLRDRGIGKLVLCGLQSEFCVSNTAFAALELGYDVFLARGAHGTWPDASRSAEQICERVEGDFILNGAGVVDLDALVTLLGAGQPPDALRLFGSRGSGSAAIECALELCETDYVVVRASAWEPDSAQAALARFNPLGQIPTLVLGDGRVLTESAAILIHLGLESPFSGLLPLEPWARAQAIRGLVFIAANCYAAISVIDYPGRWTTDTAEPAQAAVRAAARAQLHRDWEIFADLFPATPFLSGAAPGALDFLAAVVSRWSGARAHLAIARPDFAATLARIEADPLVARVFARHWPD